MVDYPMKILLIEDEKELALNTADYLSEEKYVCEFADTFSEALDKINSYSCDCILLNLMLPGGHGMTILKELKRQNKQEGVIIISAKNALEEKIKGLQIGTDDYLAKPFHLFELAARIYSVIRRKQFGNANILRMHELKLDLLAKTLLVHNKPVLLTRKEYDLLVLFIGNRNRVISKAV